MELELWRGPAVHVYVDGCARPCGAIDCNRPAVGHVVWVIPGQVRGEEVCAWHVFRLKGHVRALWFALDTQPPLEVIARAVDEHIARQQRPVYYPTVSMNNGFGAFGGTGTGGNMTFTFNM